MDLFEVHHDRQDVETMDKFQIFVNFYPRTYDKHHPARTYALNTLTCEEIGLFKRHFKNLLAILDHV